MEVKNKVYPSKVQMRGFFGTTNDNDALMISIPFGIKEVINKKKVKSNHS